MKGGPKTGWRQGEFADFSVGPLLLHVQIMNYLLVCVVSGFMAFLEFSKWGL
jgi:hypothetical protein